MKELNFEDYIVNVEAYNSKYKKACQTPSKEHNTFSDGQSFGDESDGE